MIRSESLKGTRKILTTALASNEVTCKVGQSETKQYMLFRKVLQTALDTAEDQTSKKLRTSLFPRRTES